MYHLGLTNKVAILTGASRGIGRATAQKLAESGARIVINYLNNEAAAAETARLVRAIGAEALLVPADVSRLAEAERLCETTLAHFGQLDFLICNAGVWQGAAIEEMPEEVWDFVLEANLKSTWAVCRAAVPYLKKQRKGRIVVVSSTAGQRGEAFYANYAASKGGQISFVKSLAAELGPYNININAVAPGWVDTEMSQEVLRDPAQRAVAEAGIPLGRVAQASDIAGPIVFLCSDWAGHITGEVLNVNGGSVLCG